MAASIGSHFDAHSADPAVHAAVVTPSDTTDLANATTAIYVGGTGNIQVTMLGGETVIFSNVPVGWQPIRVTRIWATNTTATTIVACWR